MPIQYNTWLEFFRARQRDDSSFCELLGSSMDLFNETTTSHLNDPNGLRLSVASNKFNFVLVTGPAKIVLFIHSAILIPQSIGKPPIIVGIQGNRSTSPFRVIPAEAITTASRTGRATVSSYSRWRIPSLKQFLEVENEEEFESLKADESTEEEEKNKPDFFQRPNHVFCHPFMIFALEGRGSIGAGEAGVKVVEQLNAMKDSAEANDVESVAGFIVGAHPTLAFLWAANQGLSEPVKLTFPPDSDNVDELCNNTLQ